MNVKKKLIEIIKKHETSQSIFNLGGTYAPDNLKEFMGTDLKTLYVGYGNKPNQYKRFDLKGIEYNTEDVSFFVVYWFNDSGIGEHSYNVINQQYFKYIKSIELKNSDLYITI